MINLISKLSVTKIDIIRNLAMLIPLMFTLNDNITFDSPQTTHNAMLLRHSLVSVLYSRKRSRG